MDIIAIFENLDGVGGSIDNFTKYSSVGGKTIDCAERQLEIPFFGVLRTVLIFIQAFFQSSLIFSYFL